MAYKRNPMRCERITSLSRYVMSDVTNAMYTSACQWFERTLDDSANKRISIPEGFLATDGILDLLANVADGLVVYDKVITKHMLAELPFMETENIMMDAVKKQGKMSRNMEGKTIFCSLLQKVINSQWVKRSLRAHYSLQSIQGALHHRLKSI